MKQCGNRESTYGRLDCGVFQFLRYSGSRDEKENAVHQANLLQLITQPSTNPEKSSRLNFRVYAKVNDAYQSGHTLGGKSTGLLRGGSVRHALISRMAWGAASIVRSTGHGSERVPINE